jgi:hypothetical protein
VTSGTIARMVSSHGRLTAFASRNWRVLLYVALILGCVLLAPREDVKFIYTEF